MLHEFVAAHRDELIERCRAKVAERLAPRPTPSEIEFGVPLFLGQLVELLRADQPHLPPKGGESKPALRVVPRGKVDATSTATKHGRELHVHGFSVNQVVHDYGDVCQAITELAMEAGVPVTVEEFQTLNMALDNAIADAVTEFGLQRAERIAANDERALTERLGFLTHELRNSLGTAMLSFAMIRKGGVAIDGATAAVLDRSHAQLRSLIDSALVDVRLRAGLSAELDRIAMDGFIAEVQVAASLEARSKGCRFSVAPVAADLWICADEQMLFSAVSNLLQNAFKFTHPHSEVKLRAYGREDRVLIEVEDECGGLPEGQAQALFRPFERYASERSGLGLGLSITSRAVEACGGKISVRDMPGIGCVFTLDFPLHLGKNACGSPPDAQTA